MDAQADILGVALLQNTGWGVKMDKEALVYFIYM